MVLFSEHVLNSQLIFFYFSYRYTLWNAEYRVSLMRNFDIYIYIYIYLDGVKSLSFSRESEVLDKECKKRNSEGGEISVEDFERMSPQVFGD